MDIIWCQYRQARSSKLRYLLLEIYKQNGLVYGLDCDQLTHGELQVLKALNKRFKGLPGNELVKQLKDRIPLAVERAFRSFDESKLSVIDRYGL